MSPRPIVLVKEPLSSGQPLHGSTEHAISREGYFVLRCPEVAWNDVRVLTPCPFTNADVEALRAAVRQERAANGPDIADAYDLESIAERIAGMLATEAARG